ncbi:MAG: hypothetical protein IIA75_04970 [Proteobacteria bacterium]|nr:hypothetical protein [Pseudomonadota bacterium]
MTEIILYSAARIVLYLAADAALKQIEKLHGEPVPYRNVVFFVIILTMAMILFPLIRLVFNNGL